MARKRGGLAGLWDRNKNIIKPVASGLAGFFGTPALGAAVGAAMGGLDRPGQSGIGFDAKRGALGGLQGYGMGQLGSMASGTALGQKLGGNALDKFGGGGLRSLLGKGAPPAPPVPSAVPSAYSGTLSPEAVGNAYTGAGVAPPSALPPPGVPPVAPAMGSNLSRLGSSIKANPTAYAMGLQGLGQLSMNQAANKQADAESRLTEAQAAKLEYEAELQRRKDESLQALRDMLSQSMPDFNRRDRLPL